MTEPNLNPASRGKRTWPFAVGALLLLALNVVIRPPDNGLSGPGYVIGYALAGATVLLVIVAVVYGVARLVRRHSTPPALTPLSFWTLLIVAGLEITTAVGRVGTTTVTLEERHGLTVQADSLRHSLLGFSIPNPGPTFLPSADLQAQLDSGLAGHPDMAGWILHSDEPPGNLVIQVIKLRSVKERAFRDFTSGLRTGASKKAKVLADTVSWTPPSGDYHLTMLFPSGLFLSTRCLSRSRANGQFVLCVQSASGDSGALSFVREGLTMVH